MRNFFKILLFVSFFIAPLITNAQPVYLYGEPKQDNKYKPLTEKQRQKKRDRLINNTDYIIQGGFVPVGAFVYSNEIFVLFKLQVSYVLRGDDVPEYVYFVAKATGYLPTNDDKMPFKVNPNPPISPENHPFLSVRSGILFLKKNTIPITSLLDASKMDKASAGIFYPDHFYPNLYTDSTETDYYDPTFKYIYQPVDETEWGIEADGRNTNEQFYGLYGKGFSYQGMYWFLHQYPNMTLPVDESFIMDYEQDTEFESHFNMRRTRR